MMRKLRPGFFESDFKFIRHLGVSTGMEEAVSDALDFQDANKAKPSLLRTGLRIRVSGRKAFGLAQRYCSGRHWLGNEHFTGLRKLHSWLECRKPRKNGRPVAS